MKQIESKLRFILVIYFILTFLLIILEVTDRSLSSFIITYVFMSLTLVFYLYKIYIEGILNLENNLNLKITENESQKKLINSQAQMSTVGEISANIAHEIYNPLTVISTIMSIISKGDGDKVFIDKKNVKLIEKSIADIVNIINSVKKLAKANSESDFILFSANEIFRPVKYILTKKLIISNIEFKLIPFDDDDKILGNESLIAQVIVNLVNNSRQAILNDKDSWIKVICSKDKNKYLISITDSGQGVDIAVIDKLFKERVTTKEGTEGTGLGLSLCKKIIDQHKGSIYVDRNSMNTCFKIEIPIP